MSKPLYKGRDGTVRTSEGIDRVAARYQREHQRQGVQMTHEEARREVASRLDNHDKKRG